MIVTNDSETENSDTFYHKFNEAKIWRETLINSFNHNFF